MIWVNCFSWILVFWVFIHNWHWLWPYFSLRVGSLFTLSFVNFYRIFRCDSWYKIHIYTYILVLCYLHFAMLWWLKQRLEFLGDAVLDYLITSYLYSVYPKLKPGQLTDLRSVSVNNNSFADVAVYRSFHKYILCDSISLCESMNKYVNFVEKSVSEEGLVEAPCPKVVNVKS